MPDFFAGEWLSVAFVITLVAIAHTGFANFVCYGKKTTDAGLIPRFLLQYVFIALWFFICLCCRCPVFSVLPDSVRCE